MNINDVCLNKSDFCNKNEFMYDPTNPLSPRKFAWVFRNRHHNGFAHAFIKINTHHNFLRVEYNPNKLGTNGCLRLRKFLIELLGVAIAKQIYFSARVTRLDLTLDIHGLKPRVQDSVVNRNLKGQIESQVLGSDKSSCRVTLYDKNAEQAARGNEVSSTPYQRVEVRLRELNCTMAELPGLKEKLLGELQQINFFSKSLFANNRFSDKFKEQVYQHGLNNVFGRINRVNRNKARRYRRYVEDYRAYPFDVHGLDFDATHWAALGTLVHPDYLGRLH